jgi:hypothetical protein
MKRSFYQKTGISPGWLSIFTLKIQNALQNIAVIFVGVRFFLRNYIFNYVKKMRHVGSADQANCTVHIEPISSP